MTYTFGPFTQLKAIHFPKKKPPPPPPPPSQVPGWFLWNPQQTIRSFGLDTNGYHEFTELRRLAGDATFNVNHAFGPFSESLASTVAALANSWIEDWNTAIQAPNAEIREITLVCPGIGITAPNVRKFVLLDTGGIITVGFGDVLTEMLKVAVQKATSGTTPYNGPFTLS